jgi:hypothetical protein
MRKIKFRLWNGAGIEQVGTITFHTDGSYHVNDEYPVNDSEMETRFGGNQYHLMQATGLKDKNGKEIYEGDIVWAAKFDQNNGKKIVASIQWDETNRLRSAHKWYLGRYTLKLARPILDRISDFDKEQKWKVIGNIYENPGLLSS